MGQSGKRLRALSIPVVQFMCKLEFSTVPLKKKFWESQCIKKANSAKKDSLSSGNLLLTTESAETWLQECEKLKHLFISWLHVSGGSQSRGTDLASYHWCNIVGAMRNIFVSQADLIFVTRYDKVRKQLGGDVEIARYPDKETSKLLFKFLTSVRPLERVVSAQFSKDEKTCKKKSAFLIYRFGQHPGDQTCQIVREQFAKAKAKVGFSFYNIVSLHVQWWDLFAKPPIY